MYSIIDVCNRALLSIGSPTITDLEDGSTEAQICKAFFDTIKSQLLCAAPWEFAQTTETLALLNRDIGGWEFEYSYPGDCLFIRALHSGDNNLYQQQKTTRLLYRVHYEKDNEIRTIRTNLENASITYTYNAPLSVFSPMAEEALRAALAGQIAYNLTGDRGVALQYYQMANDKIAQARAVDQNEIPMNAFGTVEWIAARGYYDGSYLDSYPYNNALHYCSWGPLFNV